MAHYVVIGAGIVGLATAHRLTLDNPAAQVTVLEKERQVGAHQTGHNSGVIHAGVYYTPGSLKARLCRVGSQSMMEFCAAHGVPVEACGKLIVATQEAELPRLRALHERARANGLAVRLISPAEAREYEPAVSAVAALHVSSTGIADFAAVCRVLAGLVERAGGQVRLDVRVIGLGERAGRQIVRTSAGEVFADAVVNCAGLHSDRVARMAGIDPPVRIIPFRGEYHQLRADRRHLVRGLIYPVPDPRFPFLGVHLTKMVDGSVHAGPNAVLALAREGYHRGRVRLSDLAESTTYPGLWHLARRHYRYGLGEVYRSFSRQRFAASLARLVPAITVDDLEPSTAGVRAQAVRPNGDLVDDFLVINKGRQVHVLNAPSPAATSSLEIAKYIVAQLPPSS